MEQYIPKSALVAEIERRISQLESKYKELANLEIWITAKEIEHKINGLKEALSIVNTLEVKEVDLIIHTVIAECCDWLAMNTNLSHDVIEGCRNLMLTVKEEQFKAQKGEGV